MSVWGLDIRGIQRKYPGECVGSGYPGNTEEVSW